jgi:hypothetical protein
MLGGRHLPTYLEAVNFESDLEKHHKKLGQIQNGQIKRKVIDDKDAAKLLHSRNQNSKFHNSEKHLAIEKDNELLLGRLVEISRKKQNPLFAVSDPLAQQKSLNNNFRKKEKDRIAAENEAFARRLLSQQPSFNRQKLDNDYEKHTGRVKMMQKWMGYAPRVKLPPIKYDKYEDLDRKSQSGKEKRTVKEAGKKKRRKSHKMGKLTEEEREDAAEQEEAQEKEETQRKLREAQEQKEKEENLRREENERSQKEKELLERKAQEEREKAENAKKLLAQEEAEKQRKIEEQRVQVEAPKK